VLANEGDSREYSAFDKTARVGSSVRTLPASAAPSAPKK
jgi:hypothetical protein